MLQTIGGKTVYVVEFDTMPELPITGLIYEEAVYRKALAMAAGGLDRLYSTLGGAFEMNRPTYADALNNAIETGVITEPGKYAIHLVPGTLRYEVAKIIEE